MIKSLLHFNNPDDLTKDEVKGVPWQINGTVASSQDGKFRNCLSINNDGYLQNNTIDLPLDKEWTVDMWVYADSYTSVQPIFSMKVEPDIHPPKGISIEYNSLYVSVQDNTFSWDIYNLGLSANVWNHIALVNTSSLLYAFVNGIKKVERAKTYIRLSDSPEVTVGTSSVDKRFMFKGLIDEFRISDEALWTSDFTPPATEYHQDKDKFIYIDKNNTVMGMKE